MEASHAVYNSPSHEPRLFVLKISLGDEQAPLAVRVGDDPHLLAAAFCRAHRLDAHREAELSLKIDANMRAVLAARRYISAGANSRPSSPSKTSEGASEDIRHSTTPTHSQENAQDSHFSAQSQENTGRSEGLRPNPSVQRSPRVLMRSASDPTSPLFRMREAQAPATNSAEPPSQVDISSRNLPLGSPPHEHQRAQVRSSDPTAAVVFRRRPLSRFGQSRLRRFHSSHSLSIGSGVGSGSGYAEDGVGSAKAEDGGAGGDVGGNGVDNGGYDGDYSGSGGNTQRSICESEICADVATPDSHVPAGNIEESENRNHQNLPILSPENNVSFVEDKKPAGQHRGARIFTFEHTEELERGVHPTAHVRENEAAEDTYSELAFAETRLTVTPPTARVAAGEDVVCADREVSSTDSGRTNERNSRSRKLARSSSAKPAVLRRPKSARPMASGRRPMVGGSVSNRGRTKERRRTGSVFARLHSDHEHFQKKVLSKQRQLMKEEANEIEHGKIPMSKGSQHLVRRPTNSKLKRSTDKLYREGVYRVQQRALQVPSNKKEEQELAEATFAPEISAKAKRMFGERRMSLSPRGSRRNSAASPQHGHNYEPALPLTDKTIGDQCWEQLVTAHQRRLESRTQAMREELERAQMKECTFKPKLAAQSRRIVEAKGVGRDPHTRLHQDVNYTGFPIDDDMAPECSFQPKISTMSKLLAARKQSRGYRSQSRHSSWAIHRQCSGPLRADASLSPKKNRRRQKAMLRSVSTMVRTDRAVCHEKGRVPSLVRHHSEQVLSSGKVRSRDDASYRFAVLEVENVPPNSANSKHHGQHARSPTSFRADTDSYQHHGKTRATKTSGAAHEQLRSPGPASKAHAIRSPTPRRSNTVPIRQGGISATHVPVSRSPTPRRINAGPIPQRGTSSSGIPQSSPPTGRKTNSRLAGNTSHRATNIAGGTPPTKRHDKPAKKPSSTSKRKPSERAVERQLKKKFEEIFDDLAHTVEKLPRRGFMENDEPSPLARTPQSGCLTVTQLMSAAQHTLGCDWLLVQDMVIQQQLLKFEELDCAMFSNLMLKYLRDVSKENGGISGLLGDGIASAGTSPVTRPSHESELTSLSRHERVPVDNTPTSNPRNGAQRRTPIAPTPSHSNCSRSDGSHSRNSSQTPTTPQSIISPATYARKPLVPHPPATAPPSRGPPPAAAGGKAARVAALPPKRLSFRARRSKHKSVVVQDFRPHASVVTQSTREHAEGASSEFRGELHTESKSTACPPPPEVLPLPRHQLAWSGLHSKTQSTPRESETPKAHPNPAKTPTFELEAGAEEPVSSSLVLDSDLKYVQAPKNHKEQCANVSQSEAGGRRHSRRRSSVITAGHSRRPFGLDNSRRSSGPYNSRRPKSARRVSGSRSGSKAMFDRLAKPHVPPTDHYDTECTFRPNIADSQRRCPAV